MNAPRPTRETGERDQLVAHRARSRRRRRRTSCLPLTLVGGALLTACCLASLLALQFGRLAATTSLSQSRPLTILVMGSDRRPEETGPARSDTLILAGLNPGSQEAVLLSIPRDLWVIIPGVGEQRINTAPVFGYDPVDPAAGPQLAMATVAQQFGRPVDRYLLLDFDTFVRVVDALGGVEVDVPEPITDHQYPTPDYGVTTVHFDVGPQMLDGERALIYVRTRQADSDFNRSQRQQQVIAALVRRALEPATWRRLPAALAELRSGVQSDLSAADLPALAPIIQAIGDGRLRTATLDGDLTTPWVTPGGAWVLLPNWPAINAALAQLFDSGPG